MALGTLFRVGSDPVARFAVVVTLLLPFLQPLAFDGFVPRLSALKAEGGFTRCARHLNEAK